MRARSAATFLLLASILPAASLTACSTSGSEAAAAVRAYDEALVQAFARSDASPLAPVATAGEMGRVQVLVDVKRNARLVLESELQSFEVTSSSATGDAGTVETRERWRYRDRSLEPGRPPGPELVADMRMRYALVREGGRWKVDSVATISNEVVADRPPAR